MVISFRIVAAPEATDDAADLCVELFALFEEDCGSLSNNVPIPCIFLYGGEMTPSLATFTDCTLVELTLAGQDECFTVLMDRHLAVVRKRISATVRNATDVDDLVQEVLLKVWRHLSTFRSESSFRTWMTRVAINEAYQAYRQKRRQPAYSCDLAVLASPDESPLHSVVRDEASELVRRAIAGLPEKYRQVLILREIEQLSTEQAAQRMQSSIPAVKIRLFRGRVLLLAALSRSGIRGHRAKTVESGGAVYGV
jgi:RNA polymerase sigma-70 factor (ECF subfamily)